MHYLVSVGSSLLSNYKKNHPNQTPDVNSLLSFLTNSDEKKVSAETHSLSHLPLSQEDKLVFILTQTEETRLVAQVLQEYYTKQGISCKRTEVMKLEATAESMNEDGLQALLVTLMNEISEIFENYGEVSMVATGGFKAEAAIFLLVGTLFAIPVYYIYENFSKIVQFPVFPIMPDISFQKHISFFKRAKDGIPLATAAPVLQKFPELQYFLKMTKEATYQLNYAGTLLLYLFEEEFGKRRERTFHPREKAAFLAEPKEKNKLASLKEDIPKPLYDKIELLCTLPFIEEVKLDSEQFNGERPQKRKIVGNKIYLTIQYKDFYMDIEIVSNYKKESEMVRLFWDIQELFSR
ncbi:MAG: putative CRISPR-associated protein [Candidatus Hydrogenedentota bacterium]|nr:MAG: putative CRISPR-associated protein [Candidatus Hydrogenedentota bacterium]